MTGSSKPAPHETRAGTGEELDDRAAEGRGGYRVLLAALVILFGLQVFSHSDASNPVATGVAAGSALGVALWHVRADWLRFGIGVALLVPAIIGGWLISNQTAAGAGGSPFHAPFFIYFAGTVLLQVLRARRVTEDTVLGSACAYLLLALAFASAYEAVEFFSPGAIEGLDTGKKASPFTQLSYFSLVTLTTLGYGDFSPIHPFCQSLAIVESVMGAMFPALVVARVIAVHSSPGDSPFSEPELELTREARLARVLFFFLPTVVLGLPWLEQGTFGRFAVGASFTGLIIAGVYFVTGQRSILIAGIGLAVTAEILRVMGPELNELAIALELILISIVVIRMGVWCMQQQRPTTSVILASVCLYWLIGIGFSGLFQLVEELAPGTLAPAERESVGEMIYFSFMTLTTTGYGDFVPVNEVTRKLASIEAFFGVFYPAIVIARLVSLYGERD